MPFMATHIIANQYVIKVYIRLTPYYDSVEKWRPATIPKTGHRSEKPEE
jgi:hypothetical protein